ncbi:SPOR domain-containing protein [Marinilabiliaceae bacterium JC017]|nr:SPOR domain-containing protein [Marinilabiliaceae bacterium JC017]
MNTMRRIFVLMLWCCSLLVTAQKVSSSVNPVDEVQKHEEDEGKIIIHQEEGIADLVETHIEMNKRAAGIDGYRIQLYSGAGPRAKKEALEVKSKFLSTFPEEDVEIRYNAPFWRVRVGNYRHKHETLPLMTQLKKYFPNCYAVKDGAVKMEKL